jgi:hypothetical protein
LSKQHNRHVFAGPHVEPLDPSHFATIPRHDRSSSRNDRDLVWTNRHVFPDKRRRRERFQVVESLVPHIASNINEHPRSGMARERQRTAFFGALRDRGGITLTTRSIRRRHQVLYVRHMIAPMHRDKPRSKIGEVTVVMPCASQAPEKRDECRQQRCASSNLEQKRATRRRYRVRQTVFAHDEQKRRDGR